ncbi:MAG: hypothetical protein HC781_21935 [Leptolyngbyaceae cyanobacterium CSU_1_4]|nr:hypothetical protein [Leptolyngbyaceae cyanobacterium CSU_1_4]
MAEARELPESEYASLSRENDKISLDESVAQRAKQILLNQVFQAGRVYKLNAQNRDHYDSLEDAGHKGYHYAQASTEAGSSDWIAECSIINREGKEHPLMQGGCIPLTIEDFEFKEKKVKSKVRSKV